jgi:hypothetical protein
MNSRRFLKSVAAAVLAVGMLTAGVTAPADAAVAKKPTQTTHDTGWG